MIKKIITGLGIISAIAGLSAAVLTNAQTTETTATPSSGEHSILNVGPQGRVLMRGTIASVSSGIITVNSWGGVWTVNVSSSAKVLPAAANNDITQFKTGDFVGVQGTVSTSANFTIDASLVRDWTYRQAMNQERRQNVQSASQTIKSGTPKNYAGTVSNISDSSFTLTNKKGTAFTVDVPTGTEVVNRNWINLPIANIQNGDQVHAWGINSSSTIAGQIVRDISIPSKSH